METEASSGFVVAEMNTHHFMFTGAGRNRETAAKLTAKFCHHKQVAPSAAAFMRCPVFRGTDFGQTSE